MTDSHYDNAWIREKKSWVITVNAEDMGNFEPLDPPAGVWTPEALQDLFGPVALTTLLLKGKWEGEVLIFATDGERDGQPKSRLACYLTGQSLGEAHPIYGQALMTTCALVLTPEDRKTTLGELLAWCEPA